MFKLLFLFRKGYENRKVFFFYFHFVPICEFYFHENLYGNYFFQKPFFEYLFPSISFFLFFNFFFFYFFVKHVSSDELYRTEVQKKKKNNNNNNNNKVNLTFIFFFFAMNLFTAKIICSRHDNGCRKTKISYKHLANIKTSTKSTHMHALLYKHIHKHTHTCTHILFYSFTALS